MIPVPAGSVWSLVAWGARLTGQVIALGPALGDATPAWSAAAGVTFRWPAAVSRTGLVAGATVAVALTAARVLSRTVFSLPSPDVPLAAFQSAALLLAGLAFWPDDLRKGRGAGVLAATFVMWAALRWALALDVAPDFEPALLTAAGLIQALQSLALVVLVLDRARHQVEFLRDFNATLLDGMGLGLALVGPDLRIRHANRWLTERFGNGSRRCVDTYVGAGVQCAPCPWREPAVAPREFEIDGRADRRLQITCSPLTAADGSTLLLAMVTDITDQEAMRARLLHSERLAVVGEMASRVAHELRNPLAIMNVHADLARRELPPAGDPDQAAHHLVVVQGEVRRVATLVDSYLRFGRLPAIVPAPMDVEALLTDRLATLEAELSDRGIALRRRSVAGGVTIAGDADQLGQAFMHLIRNAIEAMPGGGTLSVVTSRIAGMPEAKHFTAPSRWSPIAPRRPSSGV